MIKLLSAFNQHGRLIEAGTIIHLDPEKEQAMIASGCAELYEIEKISEEEGTEHTAIEKISEEEDTEHTPIGKTSEEEVTGHLSKEDLETNTLKELQKLAGEMGLDATGKKEEVIERIVAVEVTAGEQ